MRILAIITLIISTCIACKNSVGEQHNKVENKPAERSTIKVAKIRFEQETYDFGVIRYGEKVSHEFKFKNTGTAPLLITNAQASCGCTVPRFPKEPIQPGKDGIIEVVFNSLGKSGMQNAVITITSNSESAKNTLHLTGKIIAAIN